MNYIDCLLFEKRKQGKKNNSKESYLRYKNYMYLTMISTVVCLFPFLTDVDLLQTINFVVFFYFQIQI